ncbi:MAG: hypothetical protein WBE82_10345 [Xanthobacteraceae bacterium]
MIVVLAWSVVSSGAATVWFSACWKIGRNLCAVGCCVRELVRQKARFDVDDLPPFVFAADELVPLDEEPDAVVPGCCVPPPPLPAFAPEEEFAPLLLPEGCVCDDDPFVVLAAVFEVLPLLLSPFPLELWLLLPPEPAARLCGGGRRRIRRGGDITVSGARHPGIEQGRERLRADVLILRGCRGRRR